MSRLSEWVESFLLSADPLDVAVTKDAQYLNLLGQLAKVEAARRDKLRLYEVFGEQRYRVKAIGLAAEALYLSSELSNLRERIARRLCGEFN